MSLGETEERWAFDRNIGTGGFGVVKLFANQRTGAKIVLKECRLLSLSQDIIDRWKGEMEIIKRLDHQNIVRALNIPPGLDPMALGDTPCICMEYCDGGDLRQVLRDPENCCGLEESQIRQICSDVTQGIKFLHGKRIIHRDLKPENILLKRVGESQVIYKLTDFGYAKQYDNSSVCTSLVGTVQYVAPEVLKNKQYHSNVDFWGFGVIVFECITGKRPFLHGHPSAGFAWVDCVAKKGDKDIYIYWGEHETEPVYSTTLPQPHRLSRPFEVLLTSWLQVALHKDPLKRGTRTPTTDYAPCLADMEQNLNTMVVSALCMQTGDIYSYIVKPEDTVEDLKVQIHDSTTVPTSELFLALPNGHIMENWEHVASCIMEGTAGMVYLFSTFLEPSFKMMTDTSPSITKLIVNGDESIPKQERREVYSHTFFHIRQQYHLFERLHKGHKSILKTTHRQCVEVREQEMALNSTYHSTNALTQYIHYTFQTDLERLRNLHHTVKDPAVVNTLASWEQLSIQMQESSKKLAQLANDIVRYRQETETLLRLAEDLRSSSERNETVFYEFYQQFVIPARRIFSDAKSNHGVSTVGRMTDVLVGAKQQAEKIIQEALNGYNFIKQYVALCNLLIGLNRRKDELGALKRHVKELSDHQRNDMWKLLDQQSKQHLYENWDPVTQSMTSETAARYRKQVSSGSEQEPGKRTTWSQLSSDSEVNEQLERSLKKVTRLISVPDNEKLEKENKVLLTRLSSVVEQLSLSITNGPSPPVALESGHTAGTYADASDFRSNWQPHSYYEHAFPHY